MKRKRVPKKLTFNKVTVAHIGNDNMSKMKGGLTTVEYSKCEPCNDETWYCETQNGDITCPEWSDIWTCDYIVCPKTFPPACPTAEPNCP